MNPKIAWSADLFYQTEQTHRNNRNSAFYELLEPWEAEDKIAQRLMDENPECEFDLPYDGNMGAIYLYSYGKNNENIHPDYLVSNYVELLEALEIVTKIYPLNNAYSQSIVRLVEDSLALLEIKAIINRR